MRLPPTELEKSSTWIGAAISCFLIGATSRITIDSTPLIVLLFSKSWGFVVFNTVGCLVVSVLCVIREGRKK